MFCPKCDSLMFPDKGAFKCKKCGYSGKPDGKDSVVKESPKEKELTIIEGDRDTLPKTKMECPKCGHNEAYWIIRQTRAADEPETRILQCTKCKNKWREYN